MIPGSHVGGGRAAPLPLSLFRTGSIRSPPRRSDDPDFLGNSRHSFRTAELESVRISINGGNRGGRHPSSVGVPVKQRESRPEASEHIRRYLQEIAKIPKITPEEEKDLGRRIAGGDREALRKLVESNLRFVVSYAKRFRNQQVSFLDLINEGNIGLIQAAKKFDPEKNVKFITYAVWWVRQAILHALSEQGGAFRLPQKQASQLYRLERVRTGLARSLEREPSVEELAEETGIDLDEVGILLAAGTENVSLNTPLDEDDSFELGELLEQATIPPSDAGLMQESFERQLRDMLADLSEKERRVLTLRFGLDGSEPLTLREIGAELRLSRERVRQIEHQALEKCRRSSKARSLHGYLN
jgi:RNA polymerase primary sigma factor